MASRGSVSKSKRPERGRKERKARGARGPDEAPVFHKIGDVCAMTDTQPYVLRFWESEFPQLAPRKTRAGQRIYEREDVDLVLKIKKLLYEEEYTIAGARKRLEEEGFTAPPSAEATERSSTPLQSVEKSDDGKEMTSRIRDLREELQALREMLDSWPFFAANGRVAPIPAGNPDRGGAPPPGTRRTVGTWRSLVAH